MNRRGFVKRLAGAAAALVVLPVVGTEPFRNAVSGNDALSDEELSDLRVRVAGILKKWGWKLNRLGYSLREQFRETPCRHIWISATKAILPWNENLKSYCEISNTAARRAEGLPSLLRVLFIWREREGVLDRMVKEGTITEDEADAKKSMSLIDPKDWEFVA